MANFFKDDTIHSPVSDISISSLLASCSLGSSRSSSHSVVSSIQYKEKLYESATEALEAYIKDYEGSLLSSAVSTGKICIQTTPVKSFHCSRKVSGDTDCIEDKQAFSSSFKTEVVNDLDLASLTTDDLLAFPSDGSLPTHQAFVSKQKNKQSCKNRKSPLKKDTFCKNNLTVLSPNKVLGSGTVEMLQRFSLEADSQPTSKYFSSKNYPRWLTSQKSDLNVSGITSVPDIKYPVWLNNCGLLSDSVDKDFTSKCRTMADSSGIQTPNGLSSIAYLDKLDSSNKFENKKDLYLVSDVEGISQHKVGGIHGMSFFQQEDLVTSRSKEPFRDDMIELLILKAERALEPSLQGYQSSMEHIGSPQTEDIVEAERSWEKIPVTFKSPVPVFCDEGEDTLQTTKLHLVNDFLKDCSKNDGQNEETTLSGGNHHGPVEALKQMLFNLQTVQQSYSHETKKEEMKKLSESELLFDQEMMPVKSLQKALHHLSRLKKLVEDKNEDRDEENENLEKEQQSN